MEIMKEDFSEDIFLVFLLYNLFIDNIAQIFINKTGIGIRLKEFLPFKNKKHVGVCIENWQKDLN